MWDIRGKFIESIVNIVRFLCVILVPRTIHTHLKVVSLEKDSTQFWIYKERMKQSDNKANQQSTPSKVRLFFGICSHARNQSWYQNMSYRNIPLSTTYVKKVPENEEYNWLYANRFYVQCVWYQWYQAQMVRTKEKVDQTYSPSSEIYTHIWTVRKKSAPIPFIH